MGTTVVLGWDGLDYELTEEYGLSDEFAPYNKSIETFNNATTGEPATYELWPSIITGVPPAEHGIHLMSENKSAKMFDGTKGTITGFLHRILSDEMRIRIGLALRNRGISLNQETPEYYRRKGISTVFDGRRSRPIGIPNYRTKADQELGTVSGWGRGMAKFLDIEIQRDKESIYYKPKVPMERFVEWLIEEANRKIGLVKLCIQRDYDLVFVWLPFLDNIGHTLPAMDPENWQERGYMHALEMTNEIKTEMGDDDSLVLVSDHGHQDAHHTETPYYGSTEEKALDEVESVLDVREGIDRVAPRNTDTFGPDLELESRPEEKINIDISDGLEESLRESESEDE
ncbi:MAG: alkaline phosphatase family protein [Halobacteria archaeon]